MEIPIWKGEIQPTRPPGSLAKDLTMLRMWRLVALLTILVMVLAFVRVVAQARQRAEGRSRVVGSWRILSYELEFQDGSDRRLTLGAHPNGYLVFGADGRMMAYLEGEARKTPRTDEERAAAYRAMIAYTGRYRVEGDKWVTRVDGAWNGEWTGTDQERFFTIEGDRLTVVAQWNRNPFFDGRMTRGHLTFQREK